MTRSLLAPVAFVLAASAFGQTLSVTVSPNPAPLGTPITVTAQAVTAGLFTPGGCLLSSVSSTMPGGPTVGIFPCTFLPVAIPQCGGTAVRTGVWTPSTAVLPGDYWIQIQHQPQMFGGPITTEWHCVTLHDPVNNPRPALSAVNVPTWGQPFQMSLSAPNAAFVPYGVALSASTNVGIPYLGGHAALDPDAVFLFSLTLDPNFFVNFAGTLDGSGLSPAILLLIPPVVGVPCLPLHAQAVVFAGTPFTLSNDLHFTIM